MKKKLSSIDAMIARNIKAVKNSRTSDVRVALVFGKTSICAFTIKRPTKSEEIELKSSITAEVINTREGVYGEITYKGVCHTQMPVEFKGRVPFGYITLNGKVVGRVEAS